MEALGCLISVGKGREVGPHFLVLACGEHSRLVVGSERLDHHELALRAPGQPQPFRHADKYRASTGRFRSTDQLTGENSA